MENLFPKKGELRREVYMLHYKCERQKAYRKIALLQTEQSKYSVKE